MKYAIIRKDGITEIREDNYSLPENSIELSNSEYDQLLSGLYILQNGQVISNPNAPTDKELA